MLFYAIHSLNFTVLAFWSRVAGLSPWKWNELSSCQATKPSCEAPVAFTAGLEKAQSSKPLSA